MLDERSWWLFQAGLAALCTLVFLRSLFGAERRPRFARPELEGRTVLLAALVLISLANVATSYATATDNDELRNAGGITVRATLIVLALYVLAWRRSR